MAVLETRRLSKTYQRGEASAVDAVDLVSREGEFLVFLGPSGSGKSTLLRMIAGLEEPTGGQVFIGGRDVTHLAPRQRGIAMVFQSYALYPHLTVRENIRFPLKAQKVPKAQHAGKVEWASALLGIGHLLDRKPRQLSGGERQRVALARAIVREPELFLLDEPLSNLDAKLRASAREELAQFHDRVGTTTVYVTHDQVEAMAMGDRIVVLDHGVVRQIGTPREVYDEPADTFVATFLGSPPMNLLEAGDLVVGFRPETLAPAARVEVPAVRFQLRVTTVEYLGSEQVAYGVFEGGRFAGAKVVSRLPTSAGAFTPGALQDFAVARDQLRLFDKATTRRSARREAELGWT
ncbi:ABC transporter ATP-binding protein [Anaeromyxobacter diazotrophicus]|uniref:sn-glycerol-3-phosphate import ATP-binding protein UgpC n=1 Tax=Anaeromyxobacter diazotrophicus TaxID=2590199 RepID=A0A7I9VHZ4_9BACT|nr:ABC transporter ATP-binding protein [Anaeromyxobacter diazotrophicus]GEJ55740.1 sn-glycerol-3-phosphate import ATP-binding protein UgpC [Anaeromyxobacter diazotrophicus]